MARAALQALPAALCRQPWRRRAPGRRFRRRATLDSLESRTRSSSPASMTGVPLDRAQRRPVRDPARAHPPLPPADPRRMGERREETLEQLVAHIADPRGRPSFRLQRRRHARARGRASRERAPAVREVALRRGGRLLFEDLDLDARTRSSALQVSGPNGSGKSSLIRLAAGLLRAEARTCRTVEPGARRRCARARSRAAARARASLLGVGSRPGDRGARP